METFIIISRVIHIAAGCIALLCGLGAILNRKKLIRHRPFGLVYFWCMSVIFVTSVYLSIYRQNVFLFFIGIFTFHASFTALRALKLKGLHLGQKPLRRDWLAEALNIFANAGLLVVAGICFYHNNIPFSIICTVFGCLGLRGSQVNIKRLRGETELQNYWLIAHISGMLASYIGAITAFTVNNNRWLHLPDVAAWLGPALVLIPFVIYETAKLKKAKI